MWNISTGYLSEGLRFEDSMPVNNLFQMTHGQKYIEEIDKAEIETIKVHVTE